MTASVTARQTRLLESQTRVDPGADRQAVDPAPRVLLLTDSYWPIVGGGESHSRLLAAQLLTMGVSIRVLTQRRLTDSPATETLDGVRIDRVGYPGYKRFGKYMMMPGMMRWMADHRDQYDVVYCCGLRVLGLPGVLACKALGKQLILRSESCEELSGKHMHEHLHGSRRRALPLVKLAVELRNAVLRHADAFMAISSPIQREYAQCYVPHRKVHKVYNGIDLTIYHDGDARGLKRDLRSKLGLPQDATLITYTGKLNQGKGLMHLLQAMKQLATDRPKLHLVLVGAGANMYLSVEDELRQFVLDHTLAHRVTFTGYQTNVADYLRASDLFVIPSEMEALSISFIEALACGLPSVACNVGGLPEIGRHEREALLVPPADPDALRRAIERLIDDPALAESLAKQGKKRAAQLFDIQTVAAQHVELFKRMRVSGVEGGLGCAA